jgi:ligand-binding sensor domain-containing protein
VVVNDVLVDPRNSRRVLLATDRGGVLSSDNAGQTFVASNHGYTHRYVTSLLTDKNDPNTIFVGVLNDREWGGVFTSHDGGRHWVQKSEGLGGRDVFALQQASDGTLIAGTNRGIFLLDRSGAAWRPANVVINEKITFRTVKKGTKRVSVAVKSVKRSVLEARVEDIDILPGRWLAATSAGLLVSSDQGKSWSGGPVLGKQDLVSVRGSGDLVVAATRMAVLLSADSGTSWTQATLPSYLTIRGVTVTPNAQILIAAREGAYLSSDAGATWQHVVNGLPDKNISSITYDGSGKRLLATSTVTGVVFQSQDGGRTWSRGPDAGYPLRRVSTLHGQFVAATPFDGVILQPENESQSAAAGMGASSN